MYIDIESNENVGEAAMATFKETAPGIAVSAVRLELDGGYVWCAVVGWSDAGPVPAVLTPIEESGDGPARLLHGGSQGLRLARMSDTDSASSVRWDLADDHQWGEAFIICRPQDQYRSA